MTDLASAFMTWMRQVPHHPICSAIIDVDAGDPDDYLIRLSQRGPCDCDWAERVAQGAARAIEATCAAYEPYAPDFSDVANAAALAALRAEPGP